MSRGYRCAILAAFGWLILCGARPLAEPADSSSGAQKAAPAAQTTTAPTPTTSTSPSPKFTAYPGYNPDPCYHADDHDAADLCAQWRAAIAAEKAADEGRRATNWSIVATLLSALSLVAVAIALMLTVDSNRISRTAQRAWVRLDLLPNEIKKGHPDGLYFDLEARAENVGDTVATHFELNTRLFFKRQNEMPDDLFARLNNQVKEWVSEHSAESAATLLPKDINIERIKKDIRSKDIDWWEGFWHGAGRAQVMALVAVYYRTDSAPSKLQISWRAWYLSDKRRVRPLTFIDRNTDELDGSTMNVEPYNQSTVHEELRPRKWRRKK